MHVSSCSAYVTRSHLALLKLNSRRSELDTLSTNSVLESIVSLPSNLVAFCVNYEKKKDNYFHQNVKSYRYAR